MPNFNLKTTLPFGVADARDFIGIFEDVQQDGVNLSREEFEDEIKRDLCRVIEEHCPTRVSGQLANEMFDLMSEYIEYEENEDRYVLEDNEGLVSLSYLGGAPLLWFEDTKWACNARHCSPCCPGAADLGNPDQDGALAHCPGPADWVAAYRDNPDLKIPELIYPIEDGVVKMDEPIVLKNLIKEKANV